MPSLRILITNTKLPRSTKVLVAGVREKFNKVCIKSVISLPARVREHSGSVVECLTRDQGAMGLSLTGITAMCP